MTTTAQEIVNENFKKLDELIEDKEICQFYKDLIVTCIEEYYSEKLREAEVSDLKRYGFDLSLENFGNDPNGEWMKADEVLPKIAAMKEKITQQAKMIDDGMAIISEQNGRISQLQAEKEKMEKRYKGLADKYNVKFFVCLNRPEGKYNSGTSCWEKAELIQTFKEVTFYETEWEAEAERDRLNASLPGEKG